MDIQKKFGTDTTAEQQGIDVHLGEDAYITIRRAGGANADYQREMMRMYRKHRRTLENISMNEPEALALMYQIYSTSVVQGWRGIELEGQPLEYSRANVVKLFQAVPEVFRIVSDEATRLSNFTQEEISEQGNVSAPS